MITVIATWPDHAFDTPADAAQYATRALSDMSKALGVNEPTVAWSDGPVVAVRDGLADA